jgi:hypothetical protein
MRGRVHGVEPHEKHRTPKLSCPPELPSEITRSINDTEGKCSTVERPAGVAAATSALGRRPD